MCVVLKNAILSCNHFFRIHYAKMFFLKLFSELEYYIVESRASKSALLPSLF